MASDYQIMGQLRKYEEGKNANAKAIVANTSGVMNLSAPMGGMTYRGSDLK